MTPGGVAACVCVILLLIVRCAVADCVVCLCDVAVADCVMYLVADCVSYAAVADCVLCAGEDAEQQDAAVG